MRNNPSTTMSNQDNMVAQKENENFPEIKLKDMEDCDLNNRKFKIALIKRLKEIQKRQLNDLKNKIDEQK